MKIKQSDIHRICVAQDAELLVNMAYAEVGEDDYEVLGVFSGQGAGGGLFHQNVDGDISVSDDPGEFDTAVDMEAQRRSPVLFLGILSGTGPTLKFTTKVVILWASLRRG